MIFDFVDFSSNKGDVTGMGKPTGVLWVLLTCLAWSAPTSAREQGSLERCQNIKNQIERYTHLRRSGGTARSMEQWKQGRDQYNELYTELNCIKWRNKLK